jgi:hypothetical protein
MTLNKMQNLLYFPYINIPETSWSARTLLYYDQIGVISPRQYFYEPEQYLPYTHELVTNELVVPIDPMEALNKPWKVGEKFIEYARSKEFKMKVRRHAFSKGRRDDRHRDFFTEGPKIHRQKFTTEVFDF